MKNKQIKLLSLLLLVGFLLGCEKEHPKQDALNNELVDYFFEYQSLKSSQLSNKVDFTKFSIDEFGTYNEKVNFIPKFVCNLGFADWYNARYFEANNETVLQVPVYKDTDTEVRALIIAVQQGGNFYSYVIRRNVFDKFIGEKEPKLTLNKVMDLFTLADFKVFGKSSFLPNGKVSYKSSNSSGAILKGSFVEVERCYYMEVTNPDGTILDARWECETNLEYVSYFVESTDEEELGGGSGFDGFIGGSPASSPSPAPIPAPDTPIDNLVEYFECIDGNLPSTLTIYVDQALANTDNAYWGTTAGHCFIGIRQNGNESIFGFYPKDGPKDEGPNNSALGDDSGGEFDVSITINISEEELRNILVYTFNYPNTYDLSDFNCTDFAIQLAALGGLNLPDTYKEWPNGGGSCPGQLGQDIRNMTLPEGVLRDTSGGDAPDNMKNCAQ